MQTFYYNFDIIFSSTNMHDNNDLYIQTDQQYRITMFLVSCHKKLLKKSSSVNLRIIICFDGGVGSFLFLFFFCFCNYIILTSSLKLVIPNFVFTAIMDNCFIKDLCPFERNLRALALHVSLSPGRPSVRRYDTISHVNYLIKLN